MVKRIVDVALLRRLRAEGKTNPQISEETGWAIPTVKTWVWKLGLGKRQHIPSKRELSEEAKMQRMRELYAERGWM